MSENAQNQAADIAWDIVDKSGNRIEGIDLDSYVFGAPIKMHIMHQVVVMQDAGRRGGNASTKTRANVRGGGAKPWRQKGTGRARAGSNRSPIWKGGGVVFGPHPRDYSFTVPKKVKRAALRSALSLRVKEEQLLIVDGLKLEQIKTKPLVEILDGLGVEKALLVIPKRDDNLELSSRNLKRIKVLRAEGLNVRDILRFKQLILTPASVAGIQENLK